MDDTQAPKKNRELRTLVVVYTAVIFGALWWSGRVTSPSVYDRYHARLEGVSITVKDTARAQDFFRQVMNFAPAGQTKFALLLPDHRKLFLRPSDTPAPSEIVLRVRNGFPRLYEELQSRIGALPPAPNNPSLTPVTKQPWGEEFILTDFDGNRFIYFRARRRSVTRSE